MATTTLTATLEPKNGYFPPTVRAKYGLPALSPEEILKVPPQSDEIGWEPDLETFKTRYHARGTRTRDGNPSASLPKGWPAAVTGPLVWTAADFQQNPEPYVHQLKDEEQTEIKSALQYFRGLRLSVAKVSRETFPLEKLSILLDELSTELHSGRGFFVLRGLNPLKFTPKDNVIVYLGLSSYVGERRGRQNVEGKMITHVVETSFANIPDQLRSDLYTRKGQAFHSDTGCDILAFYCLEHAARGGSNKIASSWTIYNEMAATRPDLISALARDDWAFDTQGHQPPYFTRAPLHYTDGKIILNFSRRPIIGADVQPRSLGSPPITEVQAEALDATHFVAEKNSLNLSQERGDVTFLNNWSILHARAPYEDDGESKRHLLRLWLRNDSKGWEVPKGLMMEWDRNYMPVDEVEGFYEIAPSGKGIYKSAERRMSTG
ncbi:MAG: hypothetical protein M1817_003228 [Caeruleum heppii]|nr:MAG: hypothetical protein M1817_003228 [Caeruleum heppii]